MKYKIEPKQIFCPSCNQPMHWNGKTDVLQHVRQYACVQPNCERKGKLIGLPEIEIEEGE